MKFTKEVFGFRFGPGKKNKIYVIQLRNLKNKF